MNAVFVCVRVCDFAIATVDHSRGAKINHANPDIPHRLQNRVLPARGMCSLSTSDLLPVSPVSAQHFPNPPGVFSYALNAATGSANGIYTLAKTLVTTLKTVHVSAVSDRDSLTRPSMCSQMLLLLVISEEM